MSILDEIKPQQSIELLKHLHILTRDGKINQDSRRKLKQVYHLYQFIEPILQIVHEKNPEFTLVDHGAGKSYLGFILNDLFIKNTPGKIICIEKNRDLIDGSVILKNKLNFQNMNFVASDVADSGNHVPDNIDIVTALHACDTATDDAIKFAIDKNVDWIIMIPCCQAELAKFLRADKGSSLKKPIAELWRHGIHTREFGSHVTNVLRCLLLESKGYQVTVTELVGWEHSMKNELIIAKNIHQKKGNAVERIKKILDELNLNELESRFIY